MFPVGIEPTQDLPVNAILADPAYAQVLAILLRANPVLLTVIERWGQLTLSDRARIMDVLKCGNEQ